MHAHCVLYSPLWLAFYPQGTQLREKILQSLAKAQECGSTGRKGTMVGACLVPNKLWKSSNNQWKLGGFEYLQFLEIRSFLLTSYCQTWLSRGEKTSPSIPKGWPNLPTTHHYATSTVASPTKRAGLNGTHAGLATL
jgi:hypothetical protein